MIQDDVVNNLRTAQNQTNLNVQAKVKRRDKFVYTVILEDQDQTVKDLVLSEVFDMGANILDISSGLRGKVVRIARVKPVKRAEK